MSADKVVYLDTITRLDIPVERVLEGATEKNLTEAVVIGYDSEGEFYFSASMADGPNALWLLELAKKRLLEVADD